MELTHEFIKALEFIHPKDYMALFQDEQTKPVATTRWVLTNEIRPVDLYCYLGARFGQPNGPQNFLRNDSSDNLIHWEWVLQTNDGRFLTFQSHNFRTEIWISGDPVAEDQKAQLIELIKSDFSVHGKEMGKVRGSLEPWAEFVNPYQRARRSVERLMKDIEELNIDQEKDATLNLSDFPNPEDFEVKWDEISQPYVRAIGLAFGVRSLLPVMAESFVNLLLYILMKPEIKQDDRLRDHYIRNPIDIRIRNLPHSCVGFTGGVDFNHDACRNYHTLVNERNDLLHGNIVIDKLKFDDVYFFGTVPVFKLYHTMWDRAFGVSLRAAGIDQINSELGVVENLIEYLLSCIDEKLRDQVRFMAEHTELGIRKDTGKLGVLFGQTLVDIVLGPPTSDNK